MKIQLISLLFLILIVSYSAKAQPSARPRILGVVMGISKYQNVPSLKYADRDAMLFYNFLLSPAGGGADTNSIRLLLNEKATSYNFFEAMDNLLDMAKEGDQVYIYFAGHGDIEKKTERQNGFLIGYNAPANCYAAGGCISVRFLQDYVETLVSKNKSKVTLIIDACRSGKLAGGSQGAKITALALVEKWEGVTKILSCQPGETSLEGEQWGGGGGVFTYFMLKGMLGQADEDGDGKISGLELNHFLEKNVTKETNNKQLPDIVGDKRQEITRVDKKHALALLNQMEKPISLPPEKESAGFEADISSVNDISVLKEYEKFKYYINNNNLIAYNDADFNKETALSIYRSLEGRRQAQPIITTMKGELLAALQNKAQSCINEWLNSAYSDTVTQDNAYLELKAALSISDSTDIQYNQIKFKYMIWSTFDEKDLKIKKNLLDECYKINPNDPLIIFDLGSYFDDTKNYAEAYKYFHQATELVNKWLWAWGNKGLALGNLGKHEEAIKCYNKAIEINPDLGWAWNDKGRELIILGRVDEGIKCHDKAIELTPKSSRAWLGKGVALSEMGNYEEGLKYIDKAIELNPKNYNAWYNKGASLEKLGMPEDAMNCFDKVIELKPDYALAWYSKGIVFDAYKKYDEALKCYDKSIELQPDLAIAWHRKGMYLFMQGKNEEALKLYDKATGFDPNDFLIWGMKGAVLANLGRYEEAEKCFNKSVELNPNEEYMWNCKGNVESSLKKYEESIKSFDKALELKPDDYTVYTSKGLALAYLGKYEESLKNHNKAIEIKSDFGTAWYNLGCTYSLMKNKLEILKYLKRAIELDPKCKEDAKKDADFKEYWNDPEFLELVK